MREFKDSVTGSGKDDDELEDEDVQRPAAIPAATPAPQETARAAGIPADDAASAVPQPADEPVSRPGS
jgi:hypothetical protein